MKKFLILMALIGLLPINVNAEYEMHIPNCTQKGVENCGGFLFDTETGDVLFCGSENCIDLKLPKSWRTKQKEKQSKQDQIIEMLSNIEIGAANVTSSGNNTSAVKTEKKISTEKKEVEKIYNTAVKYIDKAVSKNLIHKNTGSRRKSQIARHLNSFK